MVMTVDHAGDDQVTGRVDNFRALCVGVGNGAHRRNVRAVDQDIRLRRLVNVAVMVVDEPTLTSFLLFSATCVSLKVR